MAANPPSQTISLPAGSYVGTANYAGIPVILFGTSSDLAYNATGGAVVNSGPFSSPVVRLACSTTAAIRVWHGVQTTAPPGTGVLFVAPGVEYIAISPGEFIMAISNDTNTGLLNITPAL